MLSCKAPRLFPWWFPVNIVLQLDSLYVSHCRYNIFWLIVTLAGLSAAVFNCTLQFLDYYRWSYYITESVQNNNAIPNPDVTVCNAFPFPNLGADSKRARAALDDLNDRKCFSNRSARAELVEEVRPVNPVCSWLIFPNVGLAARFGCDELQYGRFGNSYSYVDRRAYSCTSAISLRLVCD